MPAAVRAEQGYRHNHPLGRQGRIVNPVSKEINRQCRFSLIITVDRTERPGEIDIAGNVVKANDRHIHRDADAGFFHQVNFFPGFHVTE